MNDSKPPRKGRTAVGDCVQSLSHVEGLERAGQPVELPDVRFARLCSNDPAPAEMREPELVKRMLEVVIGEDDRQQVDQTTAYPYRCICSLRIVAADDSVWRGTGWLAGPRVVLTAGHVVYIAERGGWVKEIQITPGVNSGTAPFGRVTSSRLRTVAGWAQQQAATHDYGAILLPAGEGLGNAMGYFGFASIDDAGLIGEKATLAGYPVDQDNETMWEHSRSLVDVLPNFLVYDLDTAGGQSGSPVWVEKNQGIYATGIHSSGAVTGNTAVRITDSVFDNILAWRNETS